ncbi:hypothetical protein PWT90_05910 [Aphanocladium album]|nr:hypothetical protein PWT90_05910 [Aphanocladium album]
MQRVIFTIGLITIVAAAIRALNLLRIYLLPSRLSSYAHAAPNGDSPWALVTGASDGIGRAFAHELSSRGFNVVLHGRNHDKLSLVLAQLQARWPERSFRILVADASTVPCIGCHQDKQLHPSLDFLAIKAALDDLHLTVLINNAGGSPTNPICRSLAESSEARITDNISLNALFPTHLTRVLLPNLMRNGPALVLNISTMADQGFPLLASYSASKHFLMNLTRALGLEMVIEGKAGQVEVLGVKVGRVTGVVACKEKPSLFTPDAQTMARAALDRAGHGHGIVIGYWAHALQHVGASFLPTWAEDKVIMTIMQKERERDLKSQ